MGDIALQIKKTPKKCKFHLLSKSPTVIQEIFRLVKHYSDAVLKSMKEAMDFPPSFKKTKPWVDPMV